MHHDKLRITIFKFENKSGCISTNKKLSPFDMIQGKENENTNIMHLHSDQILHTCVKGQNTTVHRNKSESTLSLIGWSQKYCSNTRI